MESVRSVKLNEGTGTKYVGARCKRTSRSRVHGRTVIMVTGVSLSDRRRSTVGADESNEKSQ